jgi:RNA polymerase sigma-70 factor (ECF subfamily)
VPAVATRSFRPLRDDHPLSAPEPPQLSVTTGGGGITEVVRRAQTGDEAAFERIYREHAGRVYALCLRLTANGPDAEERTQDVFVRAWQQLGTFRGESAFSSWLHRLAVNVVLGERRATKRRELRVMPAEDPAALERPGRASTAGLSIDLERAIAALPEGAREVFVLYDVEGYRHQEIAELVGIAEGTSKAQLFRARRLLREMLDR